MAVKSSENAILRSLRADFSARNTVPIDRPARALTYVGLIPWWGREASVEDRIAAREILQRYIRVLS